MSTATTTTPRAEAFKLLDREGSILETARAACRALEAAGQTGMVVGGVAVVLHGHVRTTIDVDLYASNSRGAADALTAAGFTFDPTRREFRLSDIPLHLVTLDQLRIPPTAPTYIEDIAVPQLADLVAMKLRSGLANLLRAQDLADVIGLIRARDLDVSFAARIDPALRPEFRKLARAVRRVTT